MIRGLLRFLLALAPAGFRRRFGDELLAVHDERAREVGPGLGTVRFAAGELVGMTRLVLRLRWSGRDRTTGYHGREDGTMMGTFMHNARLALRSLGRNRGYALTAIAVLALGIGATTGIFTVANAFFFSPLPFQDEDGLVLLYETNPDFGWTDAEAAPANALDWREQVEGFADVAMYTSFLSDATYIGDGEPVVLSGASVTGNFFDVVGVRPELGRGFRWEETWASASPVVILSHATWSTLLGSDPGVVGATIQLDGRSVEVVGVMPQGIHFPGNQVQFWVPMGWAEEAREQVWFRRAHWVRPIARLADGVDSAEADAQLQVVVRRLSEEYPETNRVMGAGLMPLRDFLIKDTSRPVVLLMGAVLLLLALACVNVANLALVRAGERAREMGLMVALGAGRRRVAGLLVQEGVMLSLAAGLLGLAMVWMGVRLMDGLAALGIDGATSVTVDATVVGFALAVSLLSGIVFAVVPVLRVFGGDLSSALREGGRTSSTGRSHSRSVRALVAAEVGLAVLLTVGAGLMVRTYVSLRSEDPGFRVEGVLGVGFSLPEARYAERDDVLAFQDRVIRSLAARPGVQAVGMSRGLPMANTGWSGQMQARGWRPERVVEDIRHRAAGPGYFDALEIPLVRGRMFRPNEGPEDPLVVLINEEAARRHFPNEDPVGQFITNNRVVTDESLWFEIVGVVGDQRQLDPGTPPYPEIYENPRQDWSRSHWMVIRTSGDPLAQAATVRSVMAELDPLIPLAEVRTMRDVWSESMAEQQLVLLLLGSFGLAALLLAIVGVYGVTTRAARNRTQEIGVRIALGAVPGDVVGLVVRQGMVPVLMGLVIGLVGSVFTSRALSSLLYGVETSDPPTLAAVAVLLGGAAALASLVPALRASGVDPVESLRAE